MKTKAFFISFFLLPLFLFTAPAQVPSGFNYQAVVRDQGGDPIGSEEVTVEIAIKKGSMEGSTVFSETYQTMTNEFGLINLKIGSAEAFAEIDWGSEMFYLKVSIDGTQMGSSPILSVPFALYSKTSEDTFSGNFEDLVNTPDLEGFVWIEEPQEGDMFYFSGDEWEKIAPGQDGDLLTVVEGSPQWADASYSPGTVTDIDGNEYATLNIANREWMAENLRTTRFADGTDIPTGFSNSEWGDLETSAYAVYPHEDVEGIDSEQEMVDIYGKLYNWYAVTDERDLCPEGWYVPTDEEWTLFTNYLIDKYDEVALANVGNSLKSCRQVGSPLGGDCDTEEHPRWNAHSTQYGTDIFGYNALPGGFRYTSGAFASIKAMAYWWTSKEDTPDTAWSRGVARTLGLVTRNNHNQGSGFGVRCIRETE